MIEALGALELNSKGVLFAGNNLQGLLDQKATEVERHGGAQQLIGFQL